MNLLLWAVAAQTDIDPPSFPDKNKDFRRISAETFRVILDHKHAGFKRLVVVDCRTRAEFDGGHIKGAIRHHPDFDDRFDLLYREYYDPATLFIFHCEYSSRRATASIIKFSDQHAAAGRRPTTLHAFVLNAGYDQFWHKYREYCDGGYLREADLVW
jgi:rhodanese-related sulfurtransferase